MQATTLKRVLLHPRQLMDALLARSARWIKDDKLFLSLRWWCRMGYWLDWEHPKTFCEKLQWLKLYNRNPLYTRLVDKLEAKKYVADIIGEEYIIPTIGVWEKSEDIDWDALPDQFVLKTTHGGGGGGVVICRDKRIFDKVAAIEKLNRSMKSDIYVNLREWPYKDVPKRIIAEQLMVEQSADGRESKGDLPDYKFYCFNGEPTYCQVIRDRSTKETIDFYDMDWNHMPFYGLNPVSENGLNPVARPIHLDRLIEIARQLSLRIPFARIDLYVINDREYFGEVTFYPAGGFGTFTPEDWNQRLGDLVNLPTMFWGGYNIRINNGVSQISKIHNTNSELNDYKLFCFNGKCRLFKIDFGRFVEHHANYYDTDLQLLPFGEVVCPPVYDINIPIPSIIVDMFSQAEKLAKDIPFLRVDFYNVNNHIYFGELTFYPASGLSPFTSRQWDLKLGEMIDLPHLL